MKTEIKNTLYRFVTMRAPELISKDEIEQSFIQHPEIKNAPSSGKYDSIFLNKVKLNDGSKTKRQILDEVVQLFEADAIKDRHTLRKKIDHDGFYDFAIWLTKNRAKFTKAAIANYFEKDTSIQTYTIDLKLLIELWDNLFYQIITFKSNYVRDEIISLLAAYFFIGKYKESYDLESLRVFAQARVLMPKLLFEGEAEEASFSKKGKNDVTTLVNNKEMQKANELLIIENQKKQLQNIKNELLVVEKRYINSTEKDKKDYDVQYEKDTQAAYAAATPIVTSYTDTVTGRVIKFTDYENLNLPIYDFVPENELDYCLDKPASKATYVDFVQTCINELQFQTFGQVYELIDEKLKELTARQFQKTTTSKRVAAINGVVLPTSNGNSSFARTANGFTITTLTSGNNKYLALIFNGMESGVDIVSGEYNIIFNDNTEISGNYVNQSSSSEWVDGKLVLKIFNYASNYFTAPGVMTFTISGIFLSSTGRELLIGNGAGGTVRIGNGLSLEPSIYYELDNPANYTSTYVNYVATGSGKYSFEDLPSGSSGSTGSTDTNSGASDGGTSIGSGSTTGTGSTGIDSNTINQNVINYIPSGYGIKRLGVADYRKVEQQICCYVPGEVSHIENVMAREYKEKATRRLRRQEDTITTSKEKETEKLTDTTSTDRFEMNQEVSSVISEQDTIAAGSQVSWNGLVSGNAHADFAHNTSQETSDHQAVTSAQEITARVLDRVVQKVKEERITKIIEEFEETSKHGYDNRKGNQHISGVYRWVDKIYKNQVVNYGKRLIYEFMIPEPAVFHNMALEDKANSKDVEELIMPQDPRTMTGNLALTDYKAVTKDTYNYWASIYNADVEARPDDEIILGGSYCFEKTDVSGFTEVFNKADTIKINDQRYKATKGKAIIIGHDDTSRDPHMVSVCFGNKFLGKIGGLQGILVGPPPTNSGILSGSVFDYEDIGEYRNEVPVSIQFYNYHTATVNVSVKCKLTEEAEKQWQIETFNAIIKAYEDKMQEYNDKIAELKTAQAQKIKANPLFYRQIENTVLRKNCIEYLVSNDVLGKESLLTGTNLGDIRAKYDSPTLESYAAKVKFFEQAFEWDIMSYNFYPFYWASKSNWKAMYNVDELDDPIFRAFLQSGMARVIITVRPGFEEAVNWYMATGQVWNGGQVPTLDDLLYVSIVKEMQKPEGMVEDTWESRVPTSLTVIQAGTIGLNVEGLPCDEDCEDNIIYDSDNNQIKIISQSVDENGNPIQLGNITDELQTVTESIDEIKDDIQEIKTTLEGMSGGN